MAEAAGRVGLFLGASRDNRYQALLALEAEQAARKHGFLLEAFFAEGVAAQQSGLIVRFLHAHKDPRLGVVVQTVNDADASGGSLEDSPVHKLARRVLGKGAGWIVVNRNLEPHIAALRKEFPGSVTGLVTPDQKEFGRIQARQFKALLPNGGRVLYVLGNPQTSAARDRREAAIQELKGAPFNLEEVDGFWSAETARETVTRWLRTAARREEWPDLVGCQNDEMGLGAREALAKAAVEFKRPGLRDIPITGGDGLPDGGQRWVTEGKLAATIVVPATTGQALDHLAAAWRGRPMPLTTVLPPTSHPPVERLARRR